MSEVHKLNQNLYDTMVNHYEKEEFTKAIEIGKALLEKSRSLKDKHSEKKALEVLSYASYFLVDYIGAMTYIMHFSKLLEEAGSVEEKIKTNNVFISLFTRQGEYQEALNLLKKVDQMAKANHLSLETCKNLNNYGFFYNTFREYSKAISPLLQALDIAEREHYSELAAVIYGNLAIAYLRTGDLQEARQCLDELFLRSKPASSSLSLCEAYMYRGELLGAEKNFEEALSQIKASKVLAEKNGYTAELAEATQIEANLYRMMGDYERAYDCLQQHIEILGILSRNAKQGAITKLKMEYDINKKDIEADLLREQNAILEEQNRKIQDQTRELERLNAVLGRQNDDLHQSAIEDYLTGVYNRKYFTLKLQEEFSIAKEQKKDLAVIIFDIDHFKQINDTYGHLVGDEIIKHVSNICEESLDSDSLIGRFGGDEFMILMLDANKEEAMLKAQELLENIKMDPLMMDKKPIRATLSIGVSDVWHLNPKTTDELMHIADLGLYEAKQGGRNRCIIYQDKK